MMNDNPVFDRIGAEISANDVVLFMKGTPQFPQCGFSAAVVKVLSQLGVLFTPVNVLEDDTLRQGIKDYSNWPMIPQRDAHESTSGRRCVVRRLTANLEFDHTVAEFCVGKDDESVGTRAF